MGCAGSTPQRAIQADLFTEAKPHVDAPAPAPTEFQLAQARANLAAERAAKVKDGDLDPAEISEQLISQHLYTKHQPDPDLLIRTSGEMRISNFLLWQISYAELVITDTFWPDFRKAQFFAALEEYTSRHRRFGGL